LAETLEKEGYVGLRDELGLDVPLTDDTDIPSGKGEA
jgi:Fe-S cluster assembly ATP-binding protein